MAATALHSVGGGLSNLALPSGRVQTAEPSLVYELIVDALEQLNLALTLLGGFCVPRALRFFAPSLHAGFNNASCECQNPIHEKEADCRNPEVRGCDVHSRGLHGHAAGEDRGHRTGYLERKYFNHVIHGNWMAM